MEKKNISKKIGNIISNILLGETKDTVIRTEESVKRIDKDCDSLKDKMDTVKEDIGYIRPKVDFLWEKATAVSNSPKALNEEGQRIFNQSGIKDIISANQEKLISAIKRENPQKAYQVEELSEKIIQSLRDNPEILEKLREGAYQTGVNIETVLFVGSIYLRDIALKELGFKVKDLNNE